MWAAGYVACTSRARVPTTNHRASLEDTCHMLVYLQPITEPHYKIHVTCSCTYNQSQNLIIWYSSCEWQDAPHACHVLVYLQPITEPHYKIHVTCLYTYNQSQSLITRYTSRACVHTTNHRAPLQDTCHVLIYLQPITEPHYKIHVTCSCTYNQSQNLITRYMSRARVPTTNHRTSLQDTCHVLMYLQPITEPHYKIHVTCSCTYNQSQNLITRYMSCARVPTTNHRTSLQDTCHMLVYLQPITGPHYKIHVTCSCTYNQSQNLITRYTSCARVHTTNHRAPLQDTCHMLVYLQPITEPHYKIHVTCSCTYNQSQGPITRYMSRARISTTNHRTPLQDTCHVLVYLQPITQPHYKIHVTCSCTYNQSQNLITRYMSRARVPTTNHRTSLQDTCHVLVYLQPITEPHYKIHVMCSCTYNQSQNLITRYMSRARVHTINHRASLQAPSQRHRDLLGGLHRLMQLSVVSVGYFCNFPQPWREFPASVVSEFPYEKWWRISYVTLVNSYVKGPGMDVSKVTYFTANTFKQ